MGGVVGGGGKGGKSTTSGGSNVASGLENLAATQYGYGQDVIQSALPQYQQGISNLGQTLSGLTSGSYNQMTPAQQALLGTMAGEQQAGTAGTYSNLGLGGSTMESQDQNANQLRSLAEQSNLAQQNFNQQTQIAGLEGQQEGLGLQGIGTGESLLSGAGTSTAAIGNLQNAQTQNLTNTLSGLGNKSAGGANSFLSGGSSAPSSGSSFLSNLGSSASSVASDAVDAISSLFG